MYIAKWLFYALKRYWKGLVQRLMKVTWWNSTTSADVPMATTSTVQWIRSIRMASLLLFLGKGQMISGLEQVIMGMKPGGKRRALIPPELGYLTPDLEPHPREFGRQRSLMAHAKEPLVFEVQLLKVR